MSGEGLLRGSALSRKYMRLASSNPKGTAQKGVAYTGQSTPHEGPGCERRSRLCTTATKNVLRPQVFDNEPKMPKMMLPQASHLVTIRSQTLQSPYIFRFPVYYAAHRTMDIQYKQAYTTQRWTTTRTSHCNSEPWLPLF